MSPFEPDTYWENRLRARYDEQGVGDIGMSRAYNSHLYSVRRHVFRRCVRRLAVEPSKAKVLDVGSGTGVYVDEWLKWGAGEVTGLDITETAVDALRSVFPRCRFIQADIGEPSLPAEIQNGYDVVSAFDVLFHIVDDERYEQALQNVRYALRPGGWFLYSDNLVPLEARLAHYVSRSETSILDALQRNGFEVLKRMPMFVLMNDPVRTESRLLRRWYASVYRLAGRGERIGGMLGATLVPLEVAATRLIERGPGTELLLCRRSADR